MACVRQRPIRLILSFSVLFVILTVLDVIKIFPSISTALREVNDRLQQSLATFDAPTSWNATLESIHSNSDQDRTNPKRTKAMGHDKRTTKIIAFTDYQFRYVAANWFERLHSLGYTTHTIVAVDAGMVDFLNTSKTNHNDSFRYEIFLRPPLPSQYNSEPYIVKLRFAIEQLFALRWKYILHQLQQGIHVLMTDCDNIFTRYLPLSELEDSEYDVYHAYESRYPADVFEQQGFCVCGGMSWFRASPKVIQFIQMVIDQCQDMCDDQVILNRIILHQLNMTWDASPYQLGPTSSNQTEERFNGLPQWGISGTSQVTGHRVKIWDRDVAFRGPLKPNPCPPNNWVSMPLFHAFTRGQVWMDKLKAFEVWDRNCGHVHNNNNKSVFGIQYAPKGFQAQYNRKPMKIG